jgi:hypothetical protein
MGSKKIGFDLQQSLTSDGESVQRSSAVLSGPQRSSAVLSGPQRVMGGENSFLWPVRHVDASSITFFR